jgi:hypothetical protein
MGQWSDEMRSGVVRRVKAEHASQTARLASVARAADDLLTNLSRVGRGLYEIEPSAVLALRQSLEQCGVQFSERAP